MQKTILYWENNDSVDTLKQSLQAGNLAVGSSDTVFGLLANTDRLGFENLNQLKQRTAKPYIILIDNIDKLKFFIADKPSKSVLKLLEAAWPGPLTVLFRAKLDLPDFLQSVDHKIALRIPQHVGLLNLLAHFNGLFSTSANLTTEPVPALIKDLNPKIVQNVEYLILNQYNINEHNTVVPSTILDCSTEQVQLVRAGAYSVHDLEQMSDIKILI